MRGGDEPGAAGHKQRLGIAVAERFQLAQPAGQHGRDAVQWQLGVNAQQAFGLPGGQVLIGVEAQAVLQFRQPSAGMAKPTQKRGRRSA